MGYSAVQSVESEPKLLAACFMLVSCLACSSTLRMEAICSSGTPVIIVIIIIIIIVIIIIIIIQFCFIFMLTQL
jgi:hypothetical protein